jgi:hypothetical protein
LLSGEHFCAWALTREAVARSTAAEPRMAFMLEMSRAGWTVWSYTAVKSLEAESVVKVSSCLCDGTVKLRV